MAPRFLTTLVAVAALTGGGYFVYNNYSNGNVERKLDSGGGIEEYSNVAAAAADCTQTGTCDAESMYKETATEDASVTETEQVIVQEEVVEKVNEDEDDEDCTDDNDSCSGWASTGECKANPGYMLKSCRKSCLVCGKIDIDMGIEQLIGEGWKESIEDRLQKAHDYMMKDYGRDPTRVGILTLCKNKHPNCAKWAIQGECENNPKYMTTNCAPVCHSCDQLTLAARCPIDLEKMPNAWEPGDVNRYFTNITTLPEFKQFEPKVLSSPELLPGDTEETADYLVGGPWIVTLDNVLTEEEAQRLIDLGTERGYEQSFAGGKLLPDGTYERGTSEIRTSINTWCEGSCYRDPVARRVIDRITNITMIPEKNSEFLQLLKYETGTFYKTHHDYLDHGLDRQSGVRILTVFLYLNEVEQGGGTEFSNYNITVMPKVGRALIWPSVKDEDPSEKDGRTDHAALPVEKGVKYGANAWIHLRDFKTPFANGCNQVGPSTRFQEASC